MSENNENDGHVTRRELNLTMQVFSSQITEKVGEIFDEKLDAMESRWEKVSEQRYNDRILELTGESTENIFKIRNGIQYCIIKAITQFETRAWAKRAAIGAIIVMGIGSFMTWVISQLSKTIGG